MKVEEMNADTTSVETRSTPMHAPQWKTYRTRFLVKAKQLSSTLVFTDSLGRRHAGRKGDYLVESFDGVLSIAPRQIFEDIYVSIPPITAGSQLDEPAMKIDEPARVRRKLPQPFSRPEAVVSGQWSVARGASGQRG